MSNMIIQRMLDLKASGLSLSAIAEQMAHEYPNEPVNKNGWISRIRRAVDRTKAMNTAPHNSSNNIVVKEKVVESTQTESESTDYNNTKSMERKSDGSYVFEGIVEVMEGQVVTPDILMAAHKLDEREWEVITYKNNYWQQQVKGGSKIVLYQSKLVVKPRKFDDIAEIAVLEHFEKKLAEHEPVVITPPKTGHSENMLEINISDLHLGKLAFEQTCGDTYNIEIAKQRFKDLIKTEYDRAAEQRVEKILFVWTNDFFNTDGITDSTTRGTPQQTGFPWQSLFLEGCSLLVDAIELLSTLAPVESFYIASNHSRQVDYYALCYVQAWFRNNPNVNIIVNQRSRYYVKYGVTLLGFSHSYYEKKPNLKNLMCVECPQEWAETTYREFHLAHYHSEKVEEVGGVIYRWLPSMCSTDNYHYDSGYLGAVKRSYSFIYDKYTGLKQINCTIV